jgi:hypothetical protein
MVGHCINVEWLSTIAIEKMIEHCINQKMAEHCINEESLSTAAIKITKHCSNKEWTGTVATEND